MSSQFLDDWCKNPAQMEVVSIVSSAEGRDFNPERLPVCVDHARVLGARIGKGELTGYELTEGIIENLGRDCAWQLDYPCC